MIVVLQDGCSGRAEIKLFDRNDDFNCLGSILGPKKGVFSVDFGNKSDLVAYCGGDGTIQLASVQEKLTQRGSAKNEENSTQRGSVKNEERLSQRGSPNKRERGSPNKKERLIQQGSPNKREKISQRGSVKYE